MISSKRIAKNSFFYTIALIIQKVLSSLYFWYYSNNLPGGADDLGRFQYVLSFVALFFILGDLGLYLVFLREASKKPKMANRYLNTLLAIKLPLIFIASLVILFITSLWHPENLLLIGLALVFIIIDNLNFTFYAVLRSRQNLKYESMGVIIAQIVVIAVGVISIKLSGQITYLILALIAGTFINLIIVLSLLIFKLKFKIRLVYDSKIIKFFLKSLPAFAISGIIVKMLNSLDIVMLRALSATFSSVGFYSVPLKIMTALSLSIPAALMGVLYPVFSHLFASSSDYLYRVFHKSLEYLLLISVPVAFGFLSLGSEIINGLWKSEYIAAVIPGKIMFFALPFIFLSFPTGNLLNAISRQKYTAASRAIGLAAMVALDIILIPAFDLTGAAIALLITHFVIFSSDLYFLRDKLAIIKFDLLKSFARVLIASVLMFVTIELLSAYIPWYSLIVLGAGSYLLFLWLLGGLDLNFLKHLLNKESNTDLT